MLVDTLPSAQPVVLAVCIALGAWSMRIEFRSNVSTTKRNAMRSIIIATVVAVSLRGMFSIVQTGAMHDIRSFALFGASMRSGTEIYGSAGLEPYNYPPVEIWWSALASFIAPGGATNAFAALVKLPFWLADAAIVPALAWVVPRHLRVRTAWLYAINPIAITVASLHGQFDGMVVLPLLLSLGMLEKGRHDRAAALLFGLAVAFKTWPIVVLPAILVSMRAERGIRFLLRATVPVLVAALVYMLARPTVNVGFAIQLVLAYAPGTTLDFGLRLPSQWGPYLQWINIVVLVLIAASAVVAHRRAIPTAGRVATALFILIALSPTVADQYYVWPVAFLLAAGYLRVSSLYALLVGPAVAYRALYVNAPPFVHAPPVAIQVLFWLATIALIGLTVALLVRLIAPSCRWVRGITATASP